MKKIITAIPKFRSYEEFLSSSWLAVRVATLTVFIMAIQNKKVIEFFSLYEGFWGQVHSLLWTGVTAFAVLHFTIKLSKIPKQSDDGKRMRNLLGRLIMLFSVIEFLLSVGYHIIWFNVQSNTTAFTLPPFTAGFAFTLFLDALLPATLYFYGHTVHIKGESEKELEKSKKPEKEVITVPSLSPGDKLIVDVPGFGQKELDIKEIISSDVSPK